MSSPIEHAREFVKMAKPVAKRNKMAFSRFEDQAFVLSKHGRNLLRALPAALATDVDDWSAQIKAAVAECGDEAGSVVLVADVRYKHGKTEEEVHAAEWHEGLAFIIETSLGEHEVQWMAYRQADEGSIEWLEEDDKTGRSDGLATAAGRLAGFFKTKPELVH